MKRNKLLKYALIFLQPACFILLGSSGLAQSAENGFSASYECHDLNGKYRWRASTDIFSHADKEKGVFTLIENGVGVYGGFEEQISWQSSMDYMQEGQDIRPLKSRTEIFDSSGSLIAIESQAFDANKTKAVFSRKIKKTGSFREEPFTIKQDPVNRLLLGPYVQQFLKSGRKTAEIQMLSNEPRLIKCRLYIAGEEEIEISGKIIKAYKLCLEPQLGLFNFVKIFIPKSYIWHSKEPDFMWLKYRGLESGLTSPVVEIKKIKDDI